MLKLRSKGDGDATVQLSGTMKADDISIVRDSLRHVPNEATVVLDLSELRLVDRAAVRFLVRCERRGIRLLDAPRYIALWVRLERRLGEKNRQRRRLTTAGS